MAIKRLIDKLVITGKITLLTGMHIGASNDFAPIGAVDSVVVRDPVTHKPIIPGSSLKGKLRTLLARSITKQPILKKHNQDEQVICRLFGASEHEVHGIIPSRLQFWDLILNDTSAKRLKNNTDLQYTEIKFENTIDRTTAVAMPRQLERVPRGAEFDLIIVYDLEYPETDTVNELKKDSKDEEAFKELILDDVSGTPEEDFENVAKAFKLLQLDYMGGSGTRGYGKVKISDLKVEAKNVNDWNTEKLIEKLNEKLKGVEEFALLSV